jgi:LysM repeat protein
VALDPTLAALEQRLNGASTGAGLPLDESTLTKAQGESILTLFAEQLGEAEVTLAPGATVEPDPSGAQQLLVKGAATKKLFEIEKPAIHAKFTVAKASSPSEPTLALEMTIGTGAGWSLKTSFPQLAGTRLGAGLAIESAPEPVLVLRSFDGADDGFGPREQTGLNLQASLDVEKSTFLEALEPVLALTGLKTIAASGPVLRTATAESLTLRASSGVGSIKPPISGLQSIELSEPIVVLSGGAIAAEGGGWQGMASLQVWGKLSAGGDAIPLGISVPVEAPVWRLFVVPDQGVRLHQMLGFVPGLSPLDAFPDALKNAVDVEIDTFSIGLQRSASGWKPWSLDIAVTAPPWPLVPGVLEIEKVGVGLSFNLGSTPTTCSGYVTGAIQLESVELDAYVPLPLDSGEVSLWLGSPVKLPTLGDLAQLLGGEDLADHLPHGVGGIPEFELTRLAARIDLKAASLTDISFGIAAEKWAVIPGQLELEVLEISLDVAKPLKGAEVTGALRGEAALSEGSLRVSAGRTSAKADWELEVDVESLQLPSLEELAEIADPDLLELVPTKVAENSFELSTLDLKADLSKPAFEYFGFVISTESWEVTENFEITQIAFDLALDWRSGSKVSSGSLIAALLIGPPKEPKKQIALELEAEKPPEGGWVLSGKTTEPVYLSYIVHYALGVEVPKELESLELETLALTYRTADEPYEESYDFAAALDWNPSFGGVTLDVEADVALSRRPDPENKGKCLYSGHIAGDLKSHFGSDQLELAVAYTFGAPGETSYAFELDFNKVKLQATLKTVGKDSVLTVHLGGVTFGEIVEFLVNLVDPSLHFTLPAPWDVLNKIDFDALKLTMNLTQRTVGITYEANENLGIVEIGTISLTYLHKGGSATVDIAITGSFLGQTYGEEQPLQWDMLNDPPPAAPGAGPGTFDLQELAVGQHLVIADPKAETMPAVLKDVHDAIVATQGKHPWEILRFEPTAGWLFGANFTVAGTVTLGAIFDDPAMYGAQVSLAGPKAGVFAGLEFQILYRKLSDTLGQYHVELKLPDAFRHLELGEVSITLPLVILDVYTDGGFYVDLGFPAGGDWSVCFDLEIFPFLGSGGFYVGKLSAAEGASLVPAATNGRFDPVIEFGLALSEGIGKEISEGPFSAGLSLTTKGIVTGVVSYFNPSDSSQHPSLYYKIDGSVAIVGKLYGRVDFKVIAIEVSITAEVTATLAIAAYSAIHIGLSVDVEVDASIKIVFFRIHFHFQFHLDASFTIGSDQATPWQLANGGSQPRSSAARSHLRAAGRAEVAHRALRGSPSLLASPPPPLAWGAPAVMGSEPARVEVRLLPTPTAAGDALEVVVLAVLPTGAPSEHVSIEELRRAAAESGEAPFDVLAKALLRWGVQARLGRHEGTIAQAELRQIHLDLSRRDIQAQGGPFAYGNLVEFLEANLVFGLAPPPTEGEAEGGAVLPIMPPLWMSHGSTTVKFEETPKVDAKWQEEVSKAFARLLVDFEYNRSEDPLEPPPEPADFETESIAEALFSDWFLLAAKALFGAAIEATAKIARKAEEGDSLAGLAAQYAPTVEYAPRQGETQAEVAELFGVPLSAVVKVGESFEVPPPMTEAVYVVAPGETLAAIAADWRTTTGKIEEANRGLTGEPQAGTELKIPVPAELFAIADANLGVELGPGPLKLPGIAHTVQAGETLAAIGEAYEVAGIAGLEAILAANATSASLLRAGAKLEIALESGGIPYPVAKGDTAERIAAFAWVRNVGVAAISKDPRFSWFTSAIAQTNSSVSFDEPLATGTQLTIPNVQLREGLLMPVPGEETLAYETKAGDTLELIAGCFLMIELRNPELAELKAAIEHACPDLDPGATVSLPALEHEIVLGDTLHALAERFGLEAAQLAVKNVSADVFRPTAQLALPLGFSVSGTGKTLASLAALAELDVDELVGRLGGREGLFATGTALQIPGGRRQTDVEELYRDLIQGATAEVAAQASNFLARGLQVPDPTTNAMTGIYQLNRQQFAAPERSVTSLPLSFTAPSGPKWIEFPGKDGLSFDLVKAIGGRWPATALEPALTKEPERTVLAHEAQALHPMGTESQWAAASPPTLIPGKASPRSTLFPLPPQVVAKARAPGATPLAYELMTIPQGQGEAAAAEVGVYSWATWVPFTVRRIPAPGGGSLPGVYEIAAVEREGLGALLELLEDVRANGRALEPLQLLYPSPSGPLLSDALAPAKTAILKANLSTETHGSPQLAFAADPPAAAAAYAPLEVRAGFLGLLWEAGVTAAGGFHLAYETTAGTALPDAAFGAGDEAQLTALVLLQAQDRVVYPYTTGAVAAAGIDRTKMSVYARSADPGDRVTVPTAPPGNVGFGLARKNPSEAPDEEKTRTQQLYSLLGWAVEAAGGFGATAQTLPVGPTLLEPAPGPGKDWYYQQTLAAFRLASPPPLLAAGLPHPEEDPYAGVGAEAAVSLQLAFRDLFGNELDGGSQVTLPPLPFRYYDPVIGLSAWPGASARYSFAGSGLLAEIDLGVARYVPGSGRSFPAAVRAAAAHAKSYAQVHYQLQRDDVKCTLETSLDQPGAPCLGGDAVARPLRVFAMASYLYLNAAAAVKQTEYTVPSGGPAVTLATAAATYDVTLTALVEANAAADLSQLLDGELQLPRLYTVKAGETMQALATATGKGIEELLTANQLVPLAPRPGAGAYRTQPLPGDPRNALDAIAALESVTVGDLGTANAGAHGILNPAATVSFGGREEPIGPEDTLATLAEKLETTPAQLAVANAADAALLLPAAELAVPAVPVVATDPRPVAVGAGGTFAELAAANRCTVAALAEENETAAVLRSGTTIEVQGKTVEVGKEKTLASVVQALAEAKPSVTATAAEVAVAAIAVPGLLAEGAQLTAGDYVVSAGQTPAALAAAGIPLPSLAAHNTEKPANLFPAGTQLLVETASIDPSPGDSFAAIAADRGLTVAQLGAANAGAVLTPGARVAVAGAVEPLAPAPEVGQAAVYLPEGKQVTLGQVCERLCGDLGQLGAIATLNEQMPGLIAAGVRIDYPGHAAVSTAPGATLESLSRECGAADVVAFVSDPSVRDLAGLLASGALLVAPPARTAGRSLKQVATGLGIDPVDLATANSALAGLVVEGFPFKVKGAEAKAGAHSTIQSVLLRLQATEPTISMTDLVEACGEDSAALAEAALLVPPPRIEIAAAIPDPHLVSTFAPLQAAIAIARDPDLVDPGLEDASDVISNTTALAPLIDDEHGLAAFAAGFEETFAKRRLKLGAGPQPAAGAPHLYAVDFGAAGIARIELEKSAPRFYALAPLSRELASGPANIENWDPAAQKFEPVREQSFHSIDLDVWLRAALEAIDLVLSPAYAGPLWRASDSTPAAYSRIVAAKSRIAAGLRGHVAEILQGPTDEAALTAAREALYQSMLGSLTSAYTTDALIQFPVTARSPFGAPYVARDSDEGFAPAASFYRVSPESLAGSLADVPELLQAEVTVQAAATGKAYRIAAGDTLAKVAAELGFAQASELPAGISPETPLFAPGASLLVSSMERAIAAGDTFLTLAEFFGADPAAVGTAVQDVPGLIVAGTPIRGYTVAAGDTLRRIAQQVKATAAELAADPALAGEPVLAVAASVHCISPANPIAPRLSGKAVGTAKVEGSQSPPGYSLSTAKTSLAGGTSHVTFLLGVDGEESRKDLLLDLDYQPTELEIQIESVPGMGAYQASDWIRFPVALASEDFEGAIELKPGETDVPLPLRAYPALPSVLSQTAAAVDPGATEIGAAKQWGFDLAVRHQDAAQDELQILLELGEGGSSMVEAVATEPVFAALAQFNAVWPALQVALGKLPGASADEAKALAPSVEAFATIASALGEAFDPQLLHAEGREAADGAEFRFQVDYAPTGEQALDLTLVDSKGDLPVPWPGIALDGKALAAAEPAGKSRRYHLEEEVPAALHEYEFRFPEASPSSPTGFDAIRWQAASGAAAVRRNAGLVSSAETAEAFLYQTPWVRFANPAVPLIENAEPIQVGQGLDLLEPLKGALTKLLTAEGTLLSGSCDLRIQCRYAHPLIPGHDIVTHLPVLLAPLETVKGDGIEPLASKLAAMVSAWFEANRIVAAPGDAYVVDLTFYAKADGTHSKPLVELSNLRVPVLG